MTLAIIGETGLVGSEIIKILETEKDNRFKNIFFVASEKSVGKKIKYRNTTHKIVSIKKAIEISPDYALFSAGSKTSIKYANVFSKKGTTVIDNSSAFRMNKNIKFSGTKLFSNAFESAFIILIPFIMIIIIA